MSKNKVLIICASYHHGNTMKVAQTMAERLSAKIMMPADITSETIESYDLIGFGSGIYNQKHHASLFAMIDKIKSQDHRKAFVFSTNTFGIKKLNQPLCDKLSAKGFDIIAEFACKGFIDFSFIKYVFGGISKTRPDKNDLKKAAEFAEKLKLLS